MLLILLELSVLERSIGCALNTIEAHGSFEEGLGAAQMLERCGCEVNGRWQKGEPVSLILRARFQEERSVLERGRDRALDTIKAYWSIEDRTGAYQVLERSGREIS